MRVRVRSLQEKLCIASAFYSAWWSDLTDNATKTPGEFFQLLRGLPYREDQTDEAIARPADVLSPGYTGPVDCLIKAGMFWSFATAKRAISGDVLPVRWAVVRDAKYSVLHHIYPEAMGDLVGWVAYDATFPHIAHAGRKIYNEAERWIYDPESCKFSLETF